MNHTFRDIVVQIIQNLWCEVQAVKGTIKNIIERMKDFMETEDHIDTIPAKTTFHFGQFECLLKIFGFLNSFLFK